MSVVTKMTSSRPSTIVAGFRFTVFKPMDLQVSSDEQESRYLWGWKLNS